MVDLASTFSIDFFSHLSNFLENTHTQLCLEIQKRKKRKKKEKDGGTYLNKDVTMMMEETIGCFASGGNGTIMWVATCDEIAT